MREVACTVCWQFDATRLMYIQVESPVYVVRGEQVGFRVTVFNYWFADDYLEVSGGHLLIWWRERKPVVYSVSEGILVFLRFVEGEGEKKG